MDQQAQESVLPGFARTARQWLLEYDGELVEPNEQELKDLDRVMEHDEFWEWSNGKIKLPILGNTSWWQTVRELTHIGLIIGGWVLFLAIVGWFVRR